MECSCIFQSFYLVRPSSAESQKNRIFKQISSCKIHNLTFINVNLWPNLCLLVFKMHKSCNLQFMFYESCQESRLSLLLLYGYCANYTTTINIGESAVPLNIQSSNKSCFFISGLEFFAFPVFTVYPCRFSNCHLYSITFESANGKTLKFLNI